MQNPATIVVSLQEGQGALNNARRAVGLGNHKGLTDSTIPVRRAEEVVLNSDRRYRSNRDRTAINSDDELVDKQSIVSREVFIGQGS
jgi:hypothetical protein